MKQLIAGILALLFCSAGAEAAGTQILNFGSGIPFVTPGVNGNCLVSNGTIWTSGGCTGTSGVASFNLRVGVVSLTGADVHGVGGLLATNNLSDISDPAASRTSLGLTTGTSGAVLCALNANCTITGNWTFNGAVSGTGMTSLFASPPSIGNTVPGAGAFTTLSATSGITLSGLSAAVQTACLGLDSGNHVVLSGAGCGSGGGTGPGNAWLVDATHTILVDATHTARVN